jgi:AcrR family transcriptional regulator
VAIMSFIQLCHGVRTVVSVGPQNGRKRLIEVARHEFARAGFDGVTVSALAALAGVDTHVVYKLFGSKAGLLAAIRADGARPGQ